MSNTASLIFFKNVLISINYVNNATYITVSILS
jgi:hypothetical protein